MFEDVFGCGPLEVTLRTESPDLRNRFGKSLSQYDVPWERARLQITVDAVDMPQPAMMVQGNYLNCARMNVDLIPRGLYATCLSGFSGSYSVELDRWEISIPTSRGIPEEYIRCDIDDLTGLVLTTGWRRAGWVPLHSGAVCFAKSCAIVCAPSSGGKTTLITALIRRGWTTLGDDRLLLRIGQGGRPELAALLLSMNLDPKTVKWFPEVRGIEQLPTHTSFSDKRRISIEAFWPKRSILRAEPTHLFQLVLSQDFDGLRFRALTGNDLLSILLTQTVIPNHPDTARQILSILAEAARHLNGLRLDVGSDAYGNSQALSELEAAVN
jgi:hypothetical protein